MDIGIDLGTTFSVIAVKGRVELVDGYPPGQYIEECDVTIIPTPFGETTIPSVFWVDPDGSEELVGGEAKQKAQDGQSPIMFSKRSIGTTEALRIGDRSYSAKEVATHILGYLKKCAEDALGRRVHRAVITHPAYFDRNQVDETKQAAEDAGFDMSLPEQMMMEPAAAALSYLRGVSKDPVRVLTYDLGGGTFDVTILERREGVIALRAFDGDHLLGGYNFDRDLVQWMLDHLKQSGRVIPYDDDDPDDRSRRARLLQLAENIKIQLSEQRTAKIPVQIKAQDILVDDEGRNVQFVERITREQYAELIKRHLDRTIECCRSALAKADLTAAELDTILLVGGSTHGQWVAEALQHAFDVETVQHDPDLCVAAGAALRAADLPAVASGGGLELILDVPAVSLLPTINIAGELRVTDAASVDTALRDELGAWLQTPQGGTLGPSPITATAHFIFPDVDLLDDGPTEFTVQIIDGKGLERLRATFSIHYRPEDSGATEISTSLPKPLYLKTASGMRQIAEEGRALPAKCEITMQLLRNNGEIFIPVFQENDEIGTVHVEHIPPDVREGSPVIVTVEITERNEMRGDAKVLQRAGGAVAAQCPVHVKFPPIQLPDLPELRAQFDELESRRIELAAISGDPEQRLALSGLGARLGQKIDRLFGEQAPDKQELNRALKELDRLVNPPTEDLEPPRAHFRYRIDKSQELLAAAGSDPQLDPLRAALGRIETEGNEAYATKNHRKWAAINESLRMLHDRIVKVTSTAGGGGSYELPPTPILKDQYHHLVDGLRAALGQQRATLESSPNYASQFKPRADSIAMAIDKMDADIDRVGDDVDPRRASGLLQVAVRPEDQVKRWIVELPHWVR